MNERTAGCGVKCDGRWENGSMRINSLHGLIPSVVNREKVTSEQLSCVNSPRKVGDSSLFVDCRAKPAV